jgi:integrase
MVFNRAIAEGWCSKNPCLAVASIKTERDEVSVISLADARKLFEANRGHRVSLYMALEAFGGLRFSSALRIAPGDINVADKSIVLPAAKHKTGRRHVLEGLPENLWEWIRNVDVISDPLWRKNPWRMCVPVYNREKKAAFERAGLKLQPNVLRHSFCSYHVAQHQDAAKTAVLMQHANQAMIYRHYKGVATRADAAGYFAITPSSFGPSSFAGRRRGRPRKSREGSDPAGEGSPGCVSAEPA